MGDGNTVIMSVKLLLMSTGILFLTMLLLPPLVTTATSEIPWILTVVKSYLRPPYLYFIINGIIIIIVASSRLHQSHHHTPSHEREVHAPPSREVSRNQHDVVSVLMKDVGVAEVEEEVKEMMMNSSVFMTAEEVVMGETEVAATVDETEKFMWGPPPRIHHPSSPLERQEAVAGFSSERPSLVSRFGHHRRPLKANLIEGGKALRRVAKPKKHDTLESTWKAITEGRHIPLTRHLKKSDTWENNHRQIDALDSTPRPEVKKSQTFADRMTNHTSPHVASTTKLKKEPSLGQDELNRRVEAFINKFNEDMRLQRQQSMQQFMEMINRAT